MNHWSAGEERTLFREPRTFHLWGAFFLVLAAVGGGAFYYFQHQRDFVVPAPVASSAPAAETSAPAQAKPEPAQQPEATAVEPAKALPSLEHSDALMRDNVSGLVGRKAFATMVHPTELVRRIVATVDNLPRETAPRRVMPLEPVPGAFGVSGAGDEVTLTAENAQRYSAYVRVFEMLDARSLAQRYAESYPLFQRAYAELGFPDSRFHDRLLEAIDDMLEAPVPAGPVKLIRPKVFYKFADPELEGLSAGQKIMLRMGAENAAKVKAKLREIRAEITARPPR
jgi:hypothetical protein